MVFYFLNKKNPNLKKYVYISILLFKYFLKFNLI